MAASSFLSPRGHRRSINTLSLHTLVRFFINTFYFKYGKFKPSFLKIINLVNLFTSLN
ncbi:hypothetical protein KsCSTR_04740 [Candidatus Kuenenia stuttgartiensis]|uniref:Uncharacterized protein n=1 Tax=Kuenenia stuttgartiensis TaxID=174633 RepID=Q1Q0B1_KUEST|nr:hypothetical protein KsCSTR_04740 [Candidatus Kuenenia stuttgartiensis]CAJ72769.1 unknown protein [Candidatus Kuenenia stuttgartiensis]